MPLRIAGSPGNIRAEPQQADCLGHADEEGITREVDFYAAVSSAELHCRSLFSAVQPPQAYVIFPALKLRV